MKKYLLIFVPLWVMLASAQTQQGYVKTKGRMGSNGTVIPGTRLPGAMVTVRGGNAVVSGNKGFIDIMVPVTGDVYSIDGVLVRKAGAELPRLAPGLYIMNGQKVFVK